MSIEDDICIHHKGTPCFRDAVLEHHLYATLQSELLKAVEEKQSEIQIEGAPKSLAGERLNYRKQGRWEALEDIKATIISVFNKK